MNINIDHLTVGQLEAMGLSVSIDGVANTTPAKASHEECIWTNLIGKYVIVRCRDAGVHAGLLESADGRSCVLTNSRRLWYWKPANGQKYLSGVAAVGVDPASKIGICEIRKALTEDCEVTECSEVAAKSIQEAKVDENR